MRNLLVMMAVVAATGSAAAQPVDNFLVPGVDFSKLTLEVGAWCRYVVADEALDQVDSTEVYIGVPEEHETEAGPAFWVEIRTAPLRGQAEDARTMRLLVLDDILQFSDGDSLGKYVRKLYIKNGTHPIQEEDPLSYEDFSLVIPTADSSWESVADVSTGTAAGQFACTKKTRRVENDQEIPTGNVTLIRKSLDDYAVWFSDQIPVFHMARCEISRVRETNTRPPIAGIPASDRKESRTTAELAAFGFDATSILPVESASD